MSQYRILTQEDGEEGQEYPLTDRCAKTVRELRKLQVDTTFYAVQERYNMVKEMLWDEEWIEMEEEDEDSGDVRFKLKRASMNPYDFLEKVAAILFPDADVEGNAEHIDHEVAREALGDFTERTGRKRQKLSDLFA